MNHIAPARFPFDQFTRHIAQHGAIQGALESAEDMAELGIAGIPPVFADSLADDEAAEASALAAAPPPST